MAKQNKAQEDKNIIKYYQSKWDVFWTIYENILVNQVQLVDYLAQSTIQISSASQANIRKYIGKTNTEADKSQSLISLLLGRVLEQIKLIQTLLEEKEKEYKPKWHTKQ